MAAALPGLPMTGTVLVRLLRIAGGSLGDYFEPLFRAHDLSESGFHILCLLVASDAGCAAPSELSDMVGTSRANITRLLEQLEREGWIERAASERDGRRQVVAITPAGRTKVDGTVPQIAAPIERAFSDLDAGDLAELDRLLRKLVVSFDKGSVALGAAA